MLYKTRAARMRTVEDLSNRASLELAGKMSRQADVVRVAEERLVELEGYLSDYHQQRANPGPVGEVGGMQLRETHLFMEDLQQAVEAQRQTVEHARSLYESLRASWIARHIRTNALGAAVHRFEEEEQREHLAREQRDQDEIAARVAGQNGIELPDG